MVAQEKEEEEEEERENTPMDFSVVHTASFLALGNLFPLLDTEIMFIVLVHLPGTCPVVYMRSI